MRIGILGGTFNPIHKGHISLAKQALRKLRLDKIIFVPARIPPHKTKQRLIPASHRLKMVRQAIKNLPKFSVSEFEIKAKGKSYSVKTLEAFKKRFGKKAKLFFITGADSIKELATWKQINKVFDLATFVIADRPGFSIKRMPKQAKKLNIKPVNISSTKIRRDIKKGLSIARYVPKTIAEYIKKKTLYR